MKKDNTNTPFLSEAAMRVLPISEIVNTTPEGLNVLINRLVRESGARISREPQLLKNFDLTEILNKYK